MDDLIFDRLLSDVEKAINNPNNSEYLKGSYNYTDLNRVEQWCQHLMNILSNYGFAETLNIKTNWNLKDYPTRAQIDRIRHNIDKLKDFCYGIITETIVYNNTMNYEQANILEKILFDIDQYFKKMNAVLDLPYNFGTTLIRRNYVELPINTDTIETKHKVPTNYNVGILLIKRKYIKLIEEE